MISRACRWTWTPSTTCLQPKNEMLIFWLCWTSDDQPGWLMDSNPIHHPSPAKKLKWFFFGLRSTSDDWPDWVMDSNPIHHPSPAKKMKCSFLDYIQLLMIGQAGRWTRTPSTTRLQPKKWNPHFCITLHFWWSAGLVDGLEPHVPPLSSQKNEMLLFGFCSTSDDQPGWSMDSNPIHHTSPPKKMKCSFLYYIQHLMLARLVNGLEPHPPPLCTQKNEMLLLWIMLYFWWLAGLVDGLKPHPPTVSSQWNEILIFVLCWTSDDQPGWLMDWNPICHSSPAKKMKCSFLDFVQLLMTGWAGWWTRTPSTTRLHPKKWNATLWITFNFWWSPGLINGLKPHPPPLSSQRNEMLIFVLHSTSDVGQTGQWTWTSSNTPLQPIKWNAHILIMFNFWWLARLVNGLKPHPPLLSSQKKWNAHFWIMFNF